MTNKRGEFRAVNRILGEQPRIGPFPADQVFPWTAIAFVGFFVVNGIFAADLMTTGFFIAWGCATWWTLTANKSWLGKFVGVPRVTRGYKPFYSLVNLSFTDTPRQRKKRRRK